MSRLVALAASTILLSLTSVAPAMAQQAVVEVEPAARVVTTTATAVTPQPAVYAPVTQLSTSGLGGTALVYGGVAALGFAGLVALAVSDDDDNNVVSTTSSGL